MTLLRKIIAARMKTAAMRDQLLASLPARDRIGFDADFREWAHPGQLPPEGDWRTWVLMAGRGYGKTRAGAEWVSAVVRAAAVRGEGPVRIALVAATDMEARRIMIEGPSGLIAVAGHFSQRPRLEPSLKRLVWPCGAEATLFSGANPEALRGPEHHIAWCDELAKWRHPQMTWDNLQLGLRAGETPRALVTTTPRAGCATLAGILKAPGMAQSGGASGDNPYLPEAWLEAIETAYGGTHLGRQEIDGQMAEDIRGTLWPAALMERCRGESAEAVRRGLVRVVVGVDPPASAAGTCGIVACGLDEHGIGHVLADHSRGGLSPDGWARAVAAAIEVHGADRLVAEGNQGGEMVRAVLAGAGIRLAIGLVHARRGKSARAEPVAALFEAGRMQLAGRFPDLEAELAGMMAGGRYEGPGRSPDRADAMVWAVTELMLAGGEPRVSVQG